MWKMSSCSTTSVTAHCSSLITGNSPPSETGRHHNILAVLAAPTLLWKQMELMLLFHNALTLHTCLVILILQPSLCHSLPLGPSCLVCVRIMQIHLNLAFTPLPCETSSSAPNSFPIATSHPSTHSWCAHNLIRRPRSTLMRPLSSAAATDWSYLRVSNIHAF